MKRVIGALTSLLLVVFLTASAQQEQPKQQQNPPMGHMGMMHGMMPGMMHGDMEQGMHAPGGPMGLPKLTEEQQSKIQDLRLAHQKEVLPLRTDLQKQQASLKLELTADKFNEGKVKTIQSEISRLTGELTSKMVQHLRAVREILTPEQKKVFDQHILSGGPMGQGGMTGHRMMGGGMMGRGAMMHPGAVPRGPGGPGECNCMK